LSKTDKKGVTLRAHLQQVAKVTGKPPQDLVSPPFPDRAGHIWQAFLELHTGRSYSANGPNPLSWSDIKAWDDMMRVGLKDWEVRAIKALDVLWMQHTGEEETND
jgi:hypothetical protein